MDATGRNNPAKNSGDGPLKTTIWGSLFKDGLLKTTTWGALIGLSLLAAAFGFRGSFYSSHSDSTAQIEARLDSPQLPVAQPTHSAPDSAYTQQQSRQSSPARNQRRKSSASSVNRQVAPAASSVLSNLTPKFGGQNQSLSGTTSSDNQDPQTLVAAKIASDLKGIDPEKSVDVIVQFRHSPSDT